MTEDWQQGFKDAEGKKYPQRPDNQEYMKGWCFALGLSLGYENILAFLDLDSFQDGYAIAQHDRFCDGQETVMKFEVINLYENDRRNCA